MLERNYTQKNYNEDLKLINFMLFKKFNKKQFEDLEQTIQDCLFDLYQARQLFDTFKAKYSSFACKVIHSRLLKQLRFCNQVNKSMNSLDEDLGEFCLSDLIGEEMQTDEIGVVDMIKKILNKSKNTNYVKSCYLFMQGYSMRKIASMLGCSAERVSQHIEKFRAELRKELAKVGYEI